MQGVHVNQELQKRYERTLKLSPAQDQQCLYNCADIVELVYLHTKQIIHVMRKNVDFKGRNSQAVQKAKASMVNTIWVRIKTASQSVNGCSIVEIQ